MGIFLIMIVIVMIIVSLAIYLFKKGIIHSKVLVIVGSVLGGTALFVWVAMFFNFHSVSLTNESLGHFKIGEKFERDHTFVENTQFSHPKQRVYMEKENQDFVVSVDQHHRVTSIYNQSKQKNSKHLRESLLETIIHLCYKHMEINSRSSGLSKGIAKVYNIKINQTVSFWSSFSMTIN